MELGLRPLEGNVQFLLEFLELNYELLFVPKSLLEDTALLLLSSQLVPEQHFGIVVTLPRAVVGWQCGRRSLRGFIIVLIGGDLRRRLCQRLPSVGVAIEQVLPALAAEKLLVVVDVLADPFPGLLTFHYCYL